MLVTDRTSLTVACDYRELMEQDTARPKKRRAGGGGGGGAASAASAAVGTGADERRIQRVKDLGQVFGCKLFACKV